MMTMIWSRTRKKYITKNKKIRLAWKRHDDADDIKLKSLEGKLKFKEI